MKRKNQLLIPFVCTLAFLSSAADASAQMQDVSVFLSSWKSLLKSITDNVVDIILIILGLVGVVMAIPNLIKHIKGSPDASDSFLKLGSGLVLAVVIIQLCRAFIS